MAEFIEFVCPHCGQLMRAQITKADGSEQSYSKAEESLESQAKRQMLTLDGTSVEKCHEGVTEVNIPFGVTHISDGAFKGCKILKRVTIPDSVVYIGEYAFCACPELKEVTIADSVTHIGQGAFQDCHALEGIKLPPQLTEIKSSLFKVCKSLKEVIIPEGVTSVGWGAFYSCKALTSINIPEGVTSIEGCAFESCSSLTSIAIPKSVTFIGDEAFEKCESLKEVHISDISAWCGIKFKGMVSNPLYHAKNLYLKGALVTDLVITEGVTSIGDYSFYGCSSLKNIYIPASVKEIVRYTFGNNGELNKVSILCPVKDISLGKVEELTVNVAKGCSISLVGAKRLTVMGEGVVNCSDSKVLEELTLLGTECGSFGNSSALKKVVIGEGIKTINNYAFKLCANLEEVTISSSVERVGYNVFWACNPNLTIRIKNSEKDTKSWDKSWACYDTGTFGNKKFKNIIYEG